MKGFKVGINLEKGSTLNLSKTAGGLKQILVELGWEGGADLDLMAFALKEDNKVPSDAYFVFFNQQSSADGAVRLSDDEKDGGTEELEVDLDSVATQVHKISIVTHIYNWRESNITFGQVAGAYIRIINRDSGAEIARYDLEEDFSSEITVHFAELVRQGGEWSFKAVGRGSQEDLAALAKAHGVNV